MRIHVVPIVVLIGCNTSNFDAPDVDTKSDSITGGQLDEASGRDRHHRVDHLKEIGVPALVYSEHNPFANPHFDREGGDTFDKIDTDYLISIARPGIAFQAALAGVRK